jgi:hypothetical protein
MSKRALALRAPNTDAVLRQDFKQLDLPLPRVRKTRKERFETMVDRSGGPLACHPWRGSVKDANQYGQFWDINPHTGKETTRSAHRVAWELHNGMPVPVGLMVLHSRVCTTTLCCNGRHLRIGDGRENAADKIALGRAVSRKLKADDVREIVRLHRDEGARRDALATEYGVNVKCIRDIFSGRTWSKVTGINPGTRSSNNGRPRKLKVAA